ncbi:hypothetical protein D3C75_978640 [compost metagenome]
MNEVQIEVVQLQLLQGFGKRQLGALITCVLNPQLGGDKQLLARQTAAFDGASYRFLVEITRSGIDQAVTGH